MWTPSPSQTGKDSEEPFFISESKGVCFVRGAKVLATEGTSGVALGQAEACAGPLFAGVLIPARGLLGHDTAGLVCAAYKDTSDTFLTGLHL